MLESSFLFVRGVQVDGCVVDLMSCLLIFFYESVFHAGYYVRLFFVFCGVLL